MGSDIIDQLLIRYSVFVKYWKKNSRIWDWISAVNRIKKKPMIQLGGSRSIIQHSH